MQASRPTAFTSRKHLIVASLALLPLLAACGYKGPLYMPPPPPEEALTAPPQPSDRAAGVPDAARTVPVSGQ